MTFLLKQCKKRKISHKYGHHPPLIFHPHKKTPNFSSPSIEMILKTLYHYLKLIV